MKKYLRYSCSICNRSIDRLVDNTRFQTDKCVITNACEGRLSPIEYRSNAASTPTPLVGVQDWRPRSATSSSFEAARTSLLVNTSTGTSKQVFFGVLGVPSAMPSTLTVKFIQRIDTPRPYRQYIFRREGPFQSIFGVESGLEKKTLRYTTSDTVQVLLNGVQYNDFIVNDGSEFPATPVNSILFNTEINLPGVVQIDVIVFSVVPSVEVLLTIQKNSDDESRRSTGAWENVSSIQLLQEVGGWQEFTLYYFDLDDAVFSPNSILSLDSVFASNNIPMNLSGVKILLAREPYSHVDRYTSMIVHSEELQDAGFLKFYVFGGESRLDVSETAIQQVFPSFRLNKFQIEKTIPSSIAGVQNEVLLDGAVIVGPDA